MVEKWAKQCLGCCNTQNQHMNQKPSSLTLPFKGITFKKYVKMGQIVFLGIYTPLISKENWVFIKLRKNCMKRLHEMLSPRKETHLRMQQKSHSWGTKESILNHFPWNKLCSVPNFSINLFVFFSWNEILFFIPKKWFILFYAFQLHKHFHISGYS